MAEKVDIVYGRIAEGKNAIVEFRFDADIWSYKKKGDIISVRRKKALEPGSIIKTEGA